MQWLVQGGHANQTGSLNSFEEGQMRNWCLAAALGIFLASPLCAQQKAAGFPDKSSSSTAAAAEKPSKGASNAVASDKLAFSRDIFALPAAPRPKPFPQPQAATSQAAAKDPRAPGQLVPRYEVAGMYEYVNFNPGSPFASFSNHGATGSFTYNASRWLGLVGGFGGYRFDRNLFPLTGSNAGVTGGFISYLFGPRLNWRKFVFFVPSALFLVGAENGGRELVGTTNQGSFATATGGGVDMVLNKNLAWRVAQLDYFMTNFSGVQMGGNARQDNFRVGSGFVMRFGIPNPPPPPNHPPVAACSVNPASV